MLVYNGEFDVPLAAAMSHVNRTKFCEIAGDPLRAAEESEIAVSLGSDDVRTHLPGVRGCKQKAGSKATARGQPGSLRRQSPAVLF